MTHKIGRNRNTNTEANLSNVITLNATTSTKISDVNPDRLVLIISNTSLSSDIFVKFQPEATDNDKKGIFVAKGTTWTMPSDNIYTGEISAIAAVDSPDITITEY